MRQVDLQLNLPDRRNMPLLGSMPGSNAAHADCSGLGRHASLHFTAPVKSGACWLQAWGAQWPGTAASPSTPGAALHMLTQLHAS